MNSEKAQARQNSNMKGEGDHDIPTLAEGLLAMEACWEKESCFYIFLKCGPWCVNYTPVEDHISKNIWATQI